MDRIAGRDHLTIKRREYRFFPAVTVLDIHGADYVTQNGSAIRLVVWTEQPREIESIPLAEVIGAVTGNAFGQRFERHPFSAQRERDSHRVVNLHTPDST